MNVKNYRFSLTLIALLYFVFGFITWMNSVLIPFLKEVCELTDQQSYLVTFAFYISYFVIALPSSWILKKIGFSRGMAAGLAIMSIGAFLFIPAAEARSYTTFLIGLFVQGAGLALLQTAANPYVTILGPLDKAAQRMSMMGVANKVAGMIGIFAFGSILFSEMTEISHRIATAVGDGKNLELSLLSERIIAPYIGIGIGLLLLSIMVVMARLPEVKADESAEESQGKSRSLFSFTYFWLGVICLFLYVGIEVISIDTLPLYGEYQGLASETSSKLGSYSLIAMVIGYFIGIALVPKILSQSQVLTWSAALGFAFLIGAVSFSGITSICCIVLLSLSHAMMWPSIWPLAIEKMGKHTPTASAILIMAIAGGAILPLIYGGLSDYLDGNRQIPYLILAPCYVYIAFYATKGHRIAKG